MTAMGIGQQKPPPPFNPVTSLASKLVLLLDPAQESGLSDGQVLATLTDRSGNGNNGVEFSAGNGGTYRTVRWNGDPCYQMSNRGWLFQNAQVVACANGTNKNWQVVCIEQNIATLPTSYLFNWGSASSTQMVCGVRRAALGVYREQSVIRSSASAAVVTNNATIFGNFPCYRSYTRTSGGGSLFSFGEDGVVTTPFAMTDVGLAVDGLAIGALYQAGASVLSSSSLLRYWMLFNSPLTLDENAALQTFCFRNFPGLFWKRQLGGAVKGKSYIIPADGQSNNEAMGVAPYYNTTSVKAFFLSWDGFMKPLADPISDGTNNVYSLQSPSGAGSIFPRLAQDLMDNGPVTADDQIIIVNRSIGGSKSATWAAGVVSPPENGATLFGILAISLDEVLRKAPQPELLLNNWYQGESDSQNSSDASGNAANVAIVLDGINKFVAPYGVNWTKPQAQHDITQLPNSPWSAANPTFWATVATGQANLAASRSDSFSILSVSGPWIDGANQLHLAMSALIVNALNVGSTWRSK